MKNIKLLLVFFSLSTASFAKDVVLDVRTEQEFAKSHTKNAINIDVNQDEFKKTIKQLDQTDHFKIYCRSGHRAEKAINIMKEHGFLHLENLGSLENAKNALKE